MALSQPGIVFYNGVLFNGPELETLQLDGRPVPDSSGRTVMFVVWTITLRTVLNISAISPAAMDTVVQRLRARLTAYGGEFHYEQQGMPLVVNIPPTGNSIGEASNQGFYPVGDPAGTTSTTRDVVWGPKPQLLSFKLLGAGTSADVKWTVEIAIPECSNAKFAGAENLLEFNYSLSFDIDRSGYTKRIMRGHLRVPQTRISQDNRKLSYSADDARELIYPPLVPGYRRTPGVFNLSEDKCKLDFTITDEEMGPNYFNEHVVDATANHTVKTSKAFSRRWFGTLSATYELGKLRRRDEAFAHFFTLFTDRRNQAKLERDKVKGAAIVLNVEISEPEIFGRRGAAFAATYFFTSTLEGIVEASGLWRPVPGTLGSKWTASLAKFLDSRGLAQQRFDASSEVIIDLCLPSKPKYTKPPPGDGEDPGKRPPPAPGNKIPPEDASWLYYMAWFRFEEIDETAELKPLPGKGKLDVQPFLGLTAMQPMFLAKRTELIIPTNGFGSTPTPPSIPPPSAPPVEQTEKAPPKEVVMPRSIYQQRAAPSLYVWFMGYAARAGHPIPRPSINDLAGKPIIRSRSPGCHFTHGVIGNYFGVNLYGAAWALRYQVPDPPADFIPAPANPLT